ncbi:hypothetical protein ACF3NA_03880 [Alkanindiges sp. WGS2144]|uniref:hypothetical protein n=1 Tax=Alkanindiges sp. WGS2144 TaxID=3366808 RepID=UPI0037518150
MTYYCIALPLSQSFEQELSRLSQQLNAGEKRSLSEQTGKLMGEASCQIIDGVFQHMVEQLLQIQGLTEPKCASLLASLEHISAVKAVLRKYTGWAVSWFGNERLTPVVNMYASMIQRAENGQPYLMFDLPQSTAERALLALCSLEHGKVSNAEGAMESLVEVTDIGVDALIRQPKKLLHFNFVADKTLNGVINMTTAMAYKNLRKLGQQLDPLLFKAVATHLQQFIQEKKTDTL